MFRVNLVLTVSMLSLLTVFSGCAQKAEVELNFDQDTPVTYQYQEENLKQVKFERPSEEEVSDKVTKSTMTIVYDQKPVEILEDGSMLAKVTLTKLSFNSTSPKGTGLNFDSSNEKNEKNPLNKLIGQSYKIKISQTGQVEVVEPLDLQVVAKTAEFNTAERIFSKEMIQKRHNIEALTSMPQEQLKQGMSWSVTEESPKGMMQSKNYEKIYTFKGIENGIAEIEMTTIPAEGQAGAGMFAMFGDDIQSDFVDTYEGVLKFSVDTGKILVYSEDLDATWTAVDNSKSQEIPDTLIIRFGKKFSLKSVE